MTNTRYSPLELPTCSRLANRYSLRCLLRCHLGPLPLHPRLPLQVPFLDPPRLRMRSRSPPLGPDLVGCLRRRPLPPLGRRLHSRSTCLSQCMAVARCPGYTAGSGFRYDSAADADADAYLLCAYCLASPGFDCDDLRKGFCAE